MFEVGYLVKKIKWRLEGILCMKLDKVGLFVG